MQTLDTREFTEIVKTLTYGEKRELAAYLIQHMHVSDRSLRYWYSGKVTPDFCKRQVIVTALMKLFKIRTSVKTLFLNGR